MCCIVNTMPLKTIHTHVPSLKPFCNFSEKLKHWICQTRNTWSYGGPSRGTFRIAVKHVHSQLSCWCVCVGSGLNSSCSSKNLYIGFLILSVSVFWCCAQCLVTCQRHRKVACFSKKDHAFVPDEKCKHFARPAEVERCINSGIYSWRVGEYGDVSVTMKKREKLAPFLWNTNKNETLAPKSQAISTANWSLTNVNLWVLCCFPASGGHEPVCICIHLTHLNPGMRLFTVSMNVQTKVHQ